MMNTMRQKLSCRWTHLVCDTSLFCQLNYPHFFDTLMNYAGKVYRDVKGRQTLAMQLDNQSYFIKRYLFVCFKEIVKSWLNAKKPILSAANEWRALQKLDKLGIFAPQPIAIMEKKIGVFNRQSLIITKALTNTTALDELLGTAGSKKSPQGKDPWIPRLNRGMTSERPTFAFQLKCTFAVARIAKRMHASNIYHQDFYLCHFLWQHSSQRLYLIDLHRARLKNRYCRKLHVKDLGALYFSALQSGLSRHAFFRFIKAYTGQPLAIALKKQANFWQQVKTYGECLYHRPLKN